ncbi:hypothetical protein [Faecalibaculum rodentium]|uniref:hypothetical protein n=1 Tax=Faecalibaculum rodentium TaxID=1702221 RepID=UPI0025866458|nr:hypothetical protein [Faecalibaculum rodentium]
MAEHSGFHHLRPALMAAMLLMAGCAAPATVSDGSSSIQQDRTSETADRPDSGDRQAGDGTESAGASSADVQGLETEGASVLLADLKEEAVQAWEATRRTRRRSCGLKARTSPSWSRSPSRTMRRRYSTPSAGWTRKTTCRS